MQGKLILGLLALAIASVGLFNLDSQGQLQNSSSDSNQEYGYLKNRDFPFPSPQIQGSELIYSYNFSSIPREQISQGNYPYRLSDNFVPTINKMIRQTYSQNQDNLNKLTINLPQSDILHLDALFVGFKELYNIKDITLNLSTRKIYYCGDSFNQLPSQINRLRITLTDNIIDFDKNHIFEQISEYSELVDLQLDLAKSLSLSQESVYQLEKLENLERLYINIVPYNYHLRLGPKVEYLYFDDTNNFKYSYDLMKPFTQTTQKSQILKQFTINLTGDFPRDYYFDELIQLKENFPLLKKLVLNLRHDEITAKQGQQIQSKLAQAMDIEVVVQNANFVPRECNKNNIWSC